MKNCTSKTKPTSEDRAAVGKLKQLSRDCGINIRKGVVRRSSSRFCLGVEHGDYNGTELFGLGTDRFIWLAYRPNGTPTSRLFSGNFPQDGVIEFRLGDVPEPQSREIADIWGRFPYGVEYVLRRQGIELHQGIDAVLYGNIPGGGMSRSASLTINLILSLLEANDINAENGFKVVDWAQAVENDYIGSPCGRLDQIMIFFARAGMGTHYDPGNNQINYIPLGTNPGQLRLAVLDTGTVRPGLEKSTYKVRRQECEKLVSILQQSGYNINNLADVRDEATFKNIRDQFAGPFANLFRRLQYIYSAQKRFYQMLAAWRTGDIDTVGRVFRRDGLGLRDEYEISGPELETMCDIARTVPGVLGERMLGGGDKGAAGALVRTESMDELRQAVDTGYPRSHPQYADEYAVHTCKSVDGVTTYRGLLD